MVTSNNESMSAFDSDGIQETSDAGSNEAEMDVFYTPNTSWPSSPVAIPLHIGPTSTLAGSVSTFLLVSPQLCIDFWSSAWTWTIYPKMSHSSYWITLKSLTGLDSKDTTSFQWYPNFSESNAYLAYSRHGGIIWKMLQKYGLSAYGFMFGMSCYVILRCVVYTIDVT
jgi:hypothetical protein